MARECGWIQHQVFLPLRFNPRPAVFNYKDGTTSFLPPPPPTNNFITIRTKNVQSSVINSNVSRNRLSSNGNRVIQNFHQSLGNQSHATQYSNPHYCKSSSNGNRMVQEIQPITTAKPSVKETNVPRHSYSQVHQRPTNGTGTNQDSSMIIQQYSKRSGNMSAIEPSTACELSENDSRRNQEKDPPARQQSEREFAIDQDLHSILQSEDILDMFQNPAVPIQEVSGPPFPYPSTQNFLRRLFNTNRDVPSVYRYPSLSNINLNQNLCSQHSEKVNICVIGLSECEKEKLIKTFVRDDNIRISQDRPLKFVVQEEMVSFGTTLKIDIWSAEDPILAIQDLRSLCGSSKTAILLVYKATQRYTLLVVEEWIKLLKDDLGEKTPTILVASKNGDEMRLPSKQLANGGMRVKRDNDLAAFYQCSTECVQEVEEVFLFAALKAFHQKIKTAISETS